MTLSDLKLKELPSLFAFKSFSQVANQFAEGYYQRHIKPGSFRPFYHVMLISAAAGLALKWPGIKKHREAVRTGTAHH